MSAPTAFKVLTEFKFEAGAAMASTAGLQGAVDNLSQSAQNANLQFKRMGLGIAAELGLVSTSVLGLFGNMLRSFNDLEETTIKIGGILYANRSFLSGVEDANGALALTSGLLKEVARDAQRFGLSEKAIADIMAVTAAVTAKEGISLGESRVFARNILKASPQLGINPYEAQGQIQRAMLGGASMNDPAFRAIAMETQVFKDKFKDISSAAKDFNRLPIVERFRLLNSAFGQFTENAELLQRQADTLGTRLLRLRQSIFGMDGAMLPVSNITQKFAKDTLEAFQTFVNNDFRQIIESLARVLNQLVPKLENLIIMMKEVGDLSANTRKAFWGAFILNILKFIGLFRVLSWGYKLIGGGSLLAAKSALTLGGMLLKLKGVFFFLASAVGVFSKPFLLLLIVFQIISRAIGIAWVRLLKETPGLINRFIESFNLFVAMFKIVLAPINNLVNFIANLISHVLVFVYGMRGLVAAFELGVKATMLFTSALVGAFTVIIGMFDALFSGDFAKLKDKSFISGLFNEGITGFLESVYKQADVDFATRDENGQLRASSKITNINKVEINNEFKEQFEPDRIAFSIKEQIVKAAQNPVGSRYRGFSNAI